MEEKRALKKNDKKKNTWSDLCTERELVIFHYNF